MGYTLNFAQLRFGGSAWGGVEEWSCGLKLKHLGGDEPEAMHQECIDTIDDVKVAVQAYFVNGLANFNNGCKLGWVRLNVIDQMTGKYKYPNDPQLLEFTEVASPNSPAPPQIAYAVTMRGQPKRGPSSRGRFFVPVGTLTIAADGRLSVPHALNYANAAGSFLKALSLIDSGLGPDAWQPWLFGLHKAASVPLAAGEDSSIVEVEVGRVMDTQRRRRNSLVEDHVPSTTWP